MSKIIGIGAPMLEFIRKGLKTQTKVGAWTTTNESKEDIISELAVKMANGGATFDKNNTKLFAEFGSFVCKLSKTKKLTFGAQEGKHDDMVMATAIAFRCRDDYKTDNYSRLQYVRTNSKVII